MSDTSSSESETDKEKLRAAIDPDFLRKFNDKTKTSDSIVDKPVSNRIIEKVETFTPSPHIGDLEITPENKKFIAKKLEAMLEETIKIKKKKKRIETNETDEDESGIFLFSSSVSVISSQDLDKKEAEEVKRVKRKRRKIFQSISSSDEDEEKFKSVAVSSDWVLKNS